MSRTADPSASRRQILTALVLLTIAFCLVAHFLVEDISLLRAASPVAQNHSDAGLAFDEMGHQDDLVMVSGLPEAFPHNDAPAVSAWSIRLQRQSAFPIHIPPKIA